LEVENDPINHFEKFLMTSNAAYNEDLSYIHDVGFGFHARGAAQEILRVLRRHKITKGLVIDLGCGSGIWANELVRSGYDVFGVDQSKAMIRLARKKAPGVRFVRSSFLDVQLPPCAAVTSLGECFNYLFDAKNGIKELTRLFARVFDALRPGGIFEFDIAQPGQLDPTQQYRHFAGPDWFIVRDGEEDSHQMTVSRRMTIFRKVGKFYRRSEETHRLRLYWGADLARILREIGFRVRVMRGYGKYRLTGNRVALLATKPALD
jgi:SAM-dependent methyltransferase